MKYLNNIYIKIIIFIQLMGIGDWGLGIGEWGLDPIPNTPTPIPNPPTPNPTKKYKHLKINTF